MVSLRIAVIQGMWLPYRAGVFKELIKVKDMDFTFLFGKTRSSLRHQAFSRPEEISVFGFKHRFLRSIAYQGKMPTSPFHWKRSFQIFPSLLLQILKGKFDVVVADGGLFLDLPLLLLGCKLTKKPLIVWSGGNIKDNFPKPSDSLIKKIVYAYLRSVYKSSDAAIAYGSGTKEFLVALGMNPNKVFIALNTVDTFLFEEMPKINREKTEVLRETLGLRNRKVILYVGSLERRKKVDDLLALVERIKVKLPATALLIVGDGPYKNHLVQLSSEKGIQSDVKFVGWADYLDMPLYYALSDVFVLPSQGGITVMEAIASGRPVIVTEECNALYSVPGIVRNEQNGFIAKAGDLDEIQMHLYKLLANPELAEEMGVKSREIAIKLFSIDKMIQGFVEAIRYAIEMKSPNSDKCSEIQR